MPGETSMAAAVGCSALILIMASVGWAGACPKGKTGSRTCLGPTWDFQEGCNLPTTMRAQAPDPCPRRTSDALLHATEPIWLRCRSIRQEDVPADVPDATCGPFAARLPAHRAAD